MALAREIVGSGNGVLLDHDVMRFFADAEAMYTFEGTREVNTLIVGRALTGHSAFGPLNGIPASAIRRDLLICVSGLP